MTRVSYASRGLAGGGGGAHLD